MIESRREQDFYRYLEYQRAMRPQRVETLGGIATILVLSTLDLGVSPVADPSIEGNPHQPAAAAEVINFARERQAHHGRLIPNDMGAAELGYAA